MDFETEKLFDLSATAAGKYLAAFRFPWEALGGIGRFLKELAETLGDDYVRQGEAYIHKTAKVAPTACFAGLCVVGAGTEIRHGAFIRGNALIGEGCVVGNSVELKNCILFDGVQTPHFNYVGDSILGRGAHMGAGAVTSNVKSDRSPVAVRFGEETIRTGLKKFGAMVGDFVEIGCNAVLNPGTVVGRRTNIYPLVSARGAYPADSIVKRADVIVPKR